MAKFRGKFESAKQEWTTPRSLFDPLDAEFRFTLDVAADSSNAMAPEYLTADDDALACSWNSETCWLNPPYGDSANRLSDWVSKAYKESLGGATVVMLIPARTNTNWFHDLCLQHGEVRFIRGRPKFGGAEHGLPQPLCIVIFRPVPRWLDVPLRSVITGLWTRRYEPEVRVLIRSLLQQRRRLGL